MRVTTCCVLLALVSASVLAEPADTPDPPARSRDCAADPSRVPYVEPAFLGYACRDADCATHKAGFAWADRNGLADAATCAEADDPGFVEGCRAFVDEAVTAEQAGFEWARDNGIAATCRCAGAGPRFEAGCEAFVAGFAR
jgi:hypothetical protein